MKKLSLFLFVLCFSVLAMAAARTITFDFPDATNPWHLPTEYVIGEHAYALDSLSVLINGTGYIDQGVTKGGAYLYKTKDASVVALLMGQKDSYITLPAFDFDVSTIKTFGVTNGSSYVTFNVYVGDKAASTQVKGCATDQNFKIVDEYRTKGTIYTIKVNNGNNIRLGRIQVIEAVAGAPKEPIFFPPAGTYAKEQIVSISSLTEDASIQYSIDGGETFVDYTSPITVPHTTTIYAKAIKNEVESEVDSATYTIVTTIGDGTIENPYTVADVDILNNPGDTAWVGGFIIGCASDKGVLLLDSVTNNNVLIADSATATQGSPVRLSTDELKEAVGLVDRPNNLGKFLKVYGKMTKYLSKQGVTNVSDYILEAGPTIHNTPATNTNKTTKIIKNGQLLMIRNNLYYDALSNQIR